MLRLSSDVPWEVEFKEYEKQALELVKENKIESCRARISAIKEKDGYMAGKVRRSVVKYLAKNGTLKDVQVLLQFKRDPNESYRKMALGLTKRGFFQEAEKCVSLIKPIFMSGRGSDDFSHLDLGEDKRAWSEMVEILISQQNYRQARRWLQNIENEQERTGYVVRVYQGLAKIKHTIKDQCDELIETYALNRANKEKPILKEFLSQKYYYEFNTLPLGERLNLLKEYIKDDPRLENVLNYLKQLETAKAVAIMAILMKQPKPSLDAID